MSLDGMNSVVFV